MTDAEKYPWRTPGYGVKKAVTTQYTAWAEYGDGTRYTYRGTGPECLTWMVAERRAGATRHGYGDATDAAAA